ncbi:MAG TPA: alpha/beta hydrolase, partial [Methylocella sp.]|nr:alpha/beta hydrolase [Methylocella sp.]
EKGLYADGRAYLKALIASGVEGKNVILLGYSLGSGVATQMATEFGVGGVILMAPFSSIPDVAKQQFRIFPVKYFALDRFDNTAKISKIRAPLLIVNGGNDGVIPPSQGKQLFDLANEPKQFGFFPAAGHNDLFCGDFETLSLAWLRELNIHANHAASPFALPARG